MREDQLIASKDNFDEIKHMFLAKGCLWVSTQFSDKLLLCSLCECCEEGDLMMLLRVLPTGKNESEI